MPEFSFYAIKIEREQILLVENDAQQFLNHSTLVIRSMFNMMNKTGTSKVGAISKAQKAQNIFLRKTWNFRNFFSFGKCRTVPKMWERGPFLIYKHAFCCKITKNSKGDPLGTKKFSKKSHTVPKKNRKGGLFSSVRFVGYLEKVKKWKGGPFALSLPWPLCRTGRLRWFQDCF